MRIIDTSVMVSAVERKDPAAVRHLEEMTDLSIRSLIVLGELDSGVHTARDDPAVAAIRRRTLRAYRLASRPVRSLPLESVAHRFVEVTAAARHQGLRIGQNDRWIIAEAAHWDVPIWTADETMHDLARHLRGDTASLLIGPPT